MRGERSGDPKRYVLLLGKRENEKRYQWFKTSPDRGVKGYFFQDEDETFHQYHSLRGVRV